MIGQYRKCHYCKKRFRLRANKSLFGKTIPINFVMKLNHYDEPLYFHKTCWHIYQRAKAREKISRISAKFGTSGASIKGEIEEL